MNKFFDVVIVGSGVSGLFCALSIKEKYKILLVSKGSIEESNSYLAQGGITVAKGKEDIELLIEDTLKAGRMENDIFSVSILAKESIDSVKLLENLGVNFDKENGEYDYTREGGHSIKRILHTRDNTGESICKALINEVRLRSNIEIYEKTKMLDLLEVNGVCVGVSLYRDNNIINVYSKKVVLATGGIGGLFKNSTNQRVVTGDGISIALKHNVKVKDLDYIQIHPTGFYEEDCQGRRLLISESMRGEGGLLMNINGERFIDELSPRDVVSAAIYEEIEKTKVPYVYLDVRFLGEEYLKDRFTLIYNECLKRGTDISKELIRVSPVQHYLMGGIDVDKYSRTSMENLYAVGETSCTGVHGKNRLASNSLLEAVVFSKRCGENINETIENGVDGIFNLPFKSIGIIDNLQGVNLFVEVQKSFLKDRIKECFGERNYELLNY